jgi:hypothetical protein
LNSARPSKKYSVFRTAIILALIILSSSALTTPNVHGQSYKLSYDLGYAGIPFAGGLISMVSNFTNIGQLTIRVTSISFASDFWSNRTRVISTGLSLNLTAGMKQIVDSPVLIPSSALIGNHNVTATATWQYNNSSGWFNASPVTVSKVVLVSQTIDSLFPSLATTLLIALGIAGAVVVIGVFLLVRQRKKQAKRPPSPADTLSNVEIL